MLNRTINIQSNPYLYLINNLNFNLQSFCLLCTAGQNKTSYIMVGELYTNLYKIFNLKIIITQECKVLN